MAPEVADPRGKLRARLPAAALIGLGLTALYQGSSLPFGTLRQPDSGFYPTIISVALIVFGGLALVERARPPQEGEAKSAGAHARVWLVVACLGGYAWALTSVGFLLCTAALLLLLLRGLGSVSWPVSMAAAAIGSAACYGLFTRLGMPLPAGVLAF